MGTDQILYAACERNDGYPASLELGRTYPVLPDPQAAEHGLLRIVDESGEDYLYPQEYFAERRTKPHRKIPWYGLGISAAGLIVLLRYARDRVKQ